MNNLLSLQTRLQDSDLENIQLQSLELLANQIERYSNGESSSIKIEKAQDLLQSIYFTVEMYLKSLRDENAALQQLIKTPLSQLFKYGNEIIKEKFRKSKNSLNLVRGTKVITDNIAYNDTLGYGLESFFEDYDLDFFPYLDSGSIDYPLSLDITELQGVDYICSYLESLCFENNFCSHFESSEINSLLRGFNDNYKDFLINIFSLVITNLTGRILSNKDLLKLDITAIDNIYIDQYLHYMPKEEINLKLELAAEQICMFYNILNNFHKNYIYKSVLNIYPRLIFSIENGTLDTLFIRLKHEIKKPELEYVEGKRIDDEVFRKLTEEIRECRYASDKAAIIKNQITSIYDLIDIFEADCIFEEEFNYIFNTLDSLELAVLLIHINSNEAQLEWHNMFLAFFDALDISTKNNIFLIKNKMGTI